MDGGYEFEGGVKDIETFNLKPRSNLTAGIPDEQRAIHAEIYEARDVLKLLEAVGAFKRSRPMYTEFAKRIIEAAEVGCVGAGVDTKQAASALEQIRNAIVRRRGRGLIYRYLGILALLAGIGAVVGFAWFEFGRMFPDILAANFGLVLAGAMAGAWVSIAASRLEISFSEIQDYVDVQLEPVIRLVLVAIIALATAVLIQFRVLSVSLGDFNFGTFTTQANAALILGFVAGISERALSVQVIQRAKKLF